MAKYKIINGEGIIPNGTTEIEDNAFSESYELKSVTIPESVTKIGNYAFYESTLTSINIPESVTEIGAGAFSKCKALTSINIPDSVTEIGDLAFRWCEALTSINIPNSVTEIGEGAFRWCEALTSINIPDSVTEIGRWAFDGCENLKEIILFQTDPSKIKVTESSGLQKTQITLYVPKEGVTAFQEHWFWSECADIKPITDDMLK